MDKLPITGSNFVDLCKTKFYGGALPQRDRRLHVAIRVPFAKDAKSAEPAPVAPTAAPSSRSSTDREEDHPRCGREHPR